VVPVAGRRAGGSADDSGHGRRGNIAATCGADCTNRPDAAATAVRASGRRRRSESAERFVE
jgi:hypothetical protein